MVQQKVEKLVKELSKNSQKMVQQKVQKLVKKLSKKDKKMVKVAKWKKLLYINSHHAANFIFPVTRCLSF